MPPRDEYLAGETCDTLYSWADEIGTWFQSTEKELAFVKWDTGGFGALNTPKEKGSPVFSTKRNV